MQKSCTFTLLLLVQFLYSGKVGKCSRIAPPGHGLDPTSGHEYDEKGHKHDEAGTDTTRRGTNTTPISVQSVPRGSYS